MEGEDHGVLKLYHFFSWFGIGKYHATLGRKVLEVDDVGEQHSFQSTWGELDRGKRKRRTRQRRGRGTEHASNLARPTHSCATVHPSCKLLAAHHDSGPGDVVMNLNRSMNGLKFQRSTFQTSTQQALDKHSMESGCTDAGCIDWAHRLDH